MKRFIKSVIFAIAMLCAVSVRANNQPAYSTPTQDVEQVKCKITAKICGKEYTWNITTSTENDCFSIQTMVALTSLSMQNCD